MTQNNPTDGAAAAGPNKKNADARTSRTIRFSDAEWEKVEEAAAKRDNSPAEFVRNAALADAADQNAIASGALPSGILELIKRIYIGTYMLSTLKRDEMINDGRREELDQTIQAARDVQASLLDDTSK